MTYEPRRAALAAVESPATADASPFAWSGPRRAVPSRARLVGTRLAPAAVAVALLATSGGFALNRATPVDSTPLEPAPVRDADQLSRSGTRVAASGTDADQLSAAQAPAAAAPAVASAAWLSALGTVVGDQFAQSATVVRAQADAGAAESGALAKGDKVTVTDVVLNGFRQVSIGGKVGYVQADLLGERAPAQPAAAPAAKTVAAGKLLWPTAGSIGSPWGMRRHPILGYVRMHGGVDIGGASGQPIYAAADGVVTKAAYGYNSGSGNNVRIDHGMLGGKDLETAYLHMLTLKVKVGQQVKRGQLIGTVGSTGLSTAPHLHFSVYVSGVNSNPARYLQA